MLYGFIILVATSLLYNEVAAKLKVLQSEQDESRPEDDIQQQRSFKTLKTNHLLKNLMLLARPKILGKEMPKTLRLEMPDYTATPNEIFEEKAEYVEPPTTESDLLGIEIVFTTEFYDTVKPLHPNELFFSLIAKQSHVSNMFKFGEQWYTWTTLQKSDGANLTNYYMCNDEPKHCDEVGWELTEDVPKCAFQIYSLTTDDRACINSFGINAHDVLSCTGAEQVKVPDIVRECGPRIRSLWRFLRITPRPPNAVKPADVNSLLCEDEEECYVTVEYRIHHDRITLSLHEPTRGQTYKSGLTRRHAKKSTVPEPIHRKKDFLSKSDGTLRAAKIEDKGNSKERDSPYDSE